MPTKDTFKLITGKNAETISIKDARWGALLVAAVTCVGTSMFTRYRASQGERPIAKVLF